MPIFKTLQKVINEEVNILINLRNFLYQPKDPNVLFFVSLGNSVCKGSTLIKKMYMCTCCTVFEGQSQLLAVTELKILTGQAGGSFLKLGRSGGCYLQRWECIKIAKPFINIKDVKREEMEIILNESE